MKHQTEKQELAKWGRCRVPYAHGTDTIKLLHCGAQGTDEYTVRIERSIPDKPGEAMRYDLIDKGFRSMPLEEARRLAHELIDGYISRDIICAN